MNFLFSYGAVFSSAMLGGGRGGEGGRRGPAFSESLFLMGFTNLLDEAGYRNLCHVGIEPPNGNDKVSKMEIWRGASNLCRIFRHLKLQGNSLYIINMETWSRHCGSILCRHLNKLCSNIVFPIAPFQNLPFRREALEKIFTYNIIFFNCSYKK